MCSFYFYQNKEKKMGLSPTLSVIHTVTIDTMLNFNGGIHTVTIDTMLNFNGGKNGKGLKNITCKQTLTMMP